MLRKVLIGLVVLVVGAAGAYWFQPWRLFTDKTVTDTISAIPAGAPSAAAQPSAGRSSAAPPPAAPAVLAKGEFVTHEHETKGAARIVRRPDGGHQLELVGLDTSDGPDLRVWLTDQPVGTGESAWQTFDDGEYVELGRLKGNRGNQVYRIDSDVDPGDYRSVTIWCKRFSVSFGAAPLA